VSASGSATFDRLVIDFDELVEVASAENSFNYSVAPPLNVFSATLNANGRSVTLETDLQSPNTLYTVTVNGVRDPATPPNAIAPNSTISFRSFIPGCGGVLFEAFGPIGGSAVSNLVNHPSFPNSRSSGSRSIRLIHALPIRTTATTTTARACGALFIPPASGNWIFYLRADDAAELFFKPETTPMRRQSPHRRTHGRQPELHPVAPVPLVAGRGYYIEALYKEAGGADYSQVAGRLQGDHQRARAHSGRMARRRGRTAGCRWRGGHHRQPQNQSVEQNRFATLSVQATNANGLPLFYQWKRDGVDIPEANGPAYTTPRLTLADSGAQFTVEVCAIGARVLSSIAIVGVVPDITPPACVSASGTIGSSNVIVRFSEPLDANTVETFAFTVPGFNVEVATLDGTGSNVTLTLDARLVAGMNYTVEVLDFQDLAGNPASCSLAFSTQPPVVAITSPTNGATFMAGTPITVAATASSASPVSFVRFFAGTSLLGQDTKQPLQRHFSRAPRPRISRSPPSPTTRPTLPPPRRR
jgi:hypothetical protein